MNGVLHSDLNIAIGSSSSFCASAPSPSPQFLCFLWKSFTSLSSSGPIASVDMETARTMQYRWIAAWPRIETKIAGWKSERIGRTLCMRSMGVAYLRRQKKTGALELRARPAARARPRRAGPRTRTRGRRS